MTGNLELPSQECMDLNLITPSYVVTYTTAATLGVTNSSSEHVLHERELWINVILGICFVSTVLIAILGNLLVCIAVFTNRRLKKHRSNYFIVSLAVADLLVAVLVMTFATVNDILRRWIFGGIYCRIWISTDVMCSTASILNLCVISFDRYKHIQNAMHYDMSMTTRKVLMIIAAVWITSALMSFVPIHMGWHHGKVYADEPASSYDECIIKFNFIYALGSSTISFYAPCIVILVLYYRIFLFARRHSSNIKSQTMSGEPKSNISNVFNRKAFRKSDRKAATTLGVISGVFLFCWLPFFIINPINAYDPELIHPNIFVLFTWLGYLNSCLNPFIYSAFNKDYRSAFKRILSIGRYVEEEVYFSSEFSSSSARMKLKRVEYEQQSSGLNSQIPSKDNLFTEEGTCV